MKFSLISLFVVICSVSTIFGEINKKIIIDEQGIVVHGANGKKVTITKETDLGGQKYIEITVSGLNFPTKKIKIKDEGDDFMGRYDSDYYNKNLDNSFGNDYESRYKRGARKLKISQSDILVNILKEYQGDIDDVTYGRLLKQINKHVKTGEINETIYDTLEYLTDSAPFAIQNPFFYNQYQNEYVPGIQQDVLGLQDAVIPSVVGQHLYPTYDQGRFTSICGKQSILSCISRGGYLGNRLGGNQWLNNIMYNQMYGQNHLNHFMYPPHTYLDDTMDLTLSDRYLNQGGIRSLYDLEDQYWKNRYMSPVVHDLLVEQAVAGDQYGVVRGDLNDVVYQNDPYTSKRLLRKYLGNQMDYDDVADVLFNKLGNQQNQYGYGGGYGVLPGYGYHMGRAGVPFLNDVRIPQVVY